MMVSVYNEETQSVHIVIPILEEQLTILRALKSNQYFMDRALVNCSSLI